MALSKPESAEENVWTFQKRIIWSSNKQAGTEDLPSIPLFLQRSLNDASPKKLQLQCNLNKLVKSQTETVRPPSRYWMKRMKNKTSDEKNADLFHLKENFQAISKTGRKKNAWGVLIFYKLRLSLPIYFSQSFVPPWESSCPYLSEQVLQRGEKKLSHHVPPWYIFPSIFASIT